MKNIFSYLTILPLLIYYQIKLIQSQKEDQCDKSWIDELFLEFEHSRLLSRSILIFFFSNFNFVFNIWVLFKKIQMCINFKLSFLPKSPDNYHRKKKTEKGKCTIVTFLKTWTQKGSEWEQLKSPIERRYLIEIASVGTYCRSLCPSARVALIFTTVNQTKKRKEISNAVHDKHQRIQRSCKKNTKTQKYW